jgi:glycine/D-amino acid oxidase-like deaminating enzyme
MAIYCTGYELPSFVSRARHTIASTFVLATRPQRERLWPGRCLIWEASEPYLYVRDTPDGRVLCGGEDIDCADETVRDRLLPNKIDALKAKLSELLPRLDVEADFAWAGTFGGSDTGLPSIGPVPGFSNCWAVLGFGGNGIAFSQLAADLVNAAIAGRPDPDATIFALDRP